MKTGRTFAVWTAAAAALCVLALSAPRTPRTDALAQTAPVAQESQRPAAEEEMEKIAKETRIRPPMVNVLPLRDVLAKAGEFMAQGRLGPKSRVDVTAKGELNDDGRLKPETVKFNWTTVSDEVAESLAQHLVAALSQSGLFSNLEGAKEVSVRISLDETNALFSVAADMPSAERAKQLAEGYSEMLTLATVTKRGTREGEIYKSIKFSSDDKRFAFTFEMQSEALGRIIDEILAERAARAGG